MKQVQPEQRAHRASGAQRRRRNGSAGVAGPPERPAPRSQGPAGPAGASPSRRHSPTTLSELLVELEFSGVAESVRLNSFAGCFDKQLGVEYEDCYFAVARVSQPLMDWVNDTVQGINLRRNLTVVIMSPSGSSVDRRIAIGNGFLSDFSVSDLDAATAGPALLSFVVVPDSLQISVGGPVPTGGSTPQLRRNVFAFAVDDTALLGAAGVRGIHFSVEKIPAPIGALTRNLFVPGALVYDELEILVGGGSAGVTTAQYLDTWAAAVAQGQSDLRDAHLGLLAAGVEVVGITFTDLEPLSALEPLASGGRRSMTLAQQFEFAP